MTRRYYIGLSSGFSLFGVDAALVRVEGSGAELALRPEHFLQLPYGSELRELLLRVAANATPEVRHLGTLHRVLGENYAHAVRQILDQCRQLAPQVLAIGSPGLSLWHDADSRFPSQLHLGMDAVLAERSGLTVVSDFSSRDLALGGQGLPITAHVDALMFQRPQEHRVLVHLGSVANVVSMPPQSASRWRSVVGFQAAPCTMLLDGLMRLLTNGRESVDAGGKHAVQGRCLEALLERWMQNHFFQRRPPKCVPRWEFGPEFLSRAVEQGKRLNGNLHDLLCTMTHFVAHAIVHAVHTYVPMPITRVLLSGRGVRNGFLLHLLQQRLGGVPMDKTDVHGIDAEARQAVAHGGLAALAMDGVTGASGSRLHGQLTPGSPANWARCLAWMARQAAPPQSAAA